METLPLFVSIIFGLTTLLSAWFFYKASHYSIKVLAFIGIWLGLQTLISISEFYTVTSTLPPRMLLLVLPPFILIILLFLTERGRQFIDGLNRPLLTLLHVVRVPVELVLFWLSVSGTVPVLMTFEGRNFDILAGLTAPLIYYLGFVKNKLPVTVLLGWNIICLGLLSNIVFHGILSIPTPFQQFGFDQPNIALLYFPFVLLPGFIVPLVFFSHLATIRYLIIQKKTEPQKSVETKALVI